MATTRITDIYEPGPFDRQSLLRTKELSEFWQSGILRQDPLLTQFASGPGSTIEVPKLRPLGGTRNISSDDPSETSTPNKIQTDLEKAIKHFSNNSWSQMDLVAALTDPKDPLGQLSNTVGEYWMRTNQLILMATINGIIAANEAGNGETGEAGDMVHDVATDAAGEPTAAEKVSHTNITRTMLTSGDALNDLKAIGVHSGVYGTLLENDQIEFEKPSETGMRIPFFGDLRVIVDDGFPVEEGVERLTYTSVLFGAGSIGYAEATPKTPSEVERHPDKGNGEGEEILYSRRHTVLHPFGFAWTGSSVAGKSPTDAELALAANWNRVYPERKQVPLAFLKTNG